MVIMNTTAMPERCAECDFCINQRTNDYGSFGECLLHKYKMVNCLAWRRDNECPLSGVKTIYTDTNGNAKILTYKNIKDINKGE